MLVIYQIPIFDFRRFEGEPHFLKIPLWPSPMEEEFVRGVGGIVYRKNGGLNNWIGESKICLAKRSIIFGKLPVFSFTENGEQQNIPMKPTFRRFYFDGEAIGKYEVGFALNRTAPLTIKLSEIEAFVNAVFNTEVVIPIVGQPAERSLLGHAGKKLAQQYLNATSKLTTSYEGDQKAIKYGHPLFYVNAGHLETIDFDVPSETIDLQDDLTLAQLLLRKQNKTIKVWVSDNTQTNADLARKLRISVLRLDAFLQGLPKLFKEIVREKIKPERGSEQSEALQHFLNKSNRRILQFSKKFDEKIIEKAKEVYDKLNPGERTALREKLDQDMDIRRNISSNAKDYANSITSEEEEAPTKKVLFIAANPMDTTRLQIGRELREIREELSQGTEKDNIQMLFPELALTFDRLQQVLMEESPNILHFSGHGDANGIILENEEGQFQLVETKALNRLFTLFGDAIECVVLNACYSEPQAKAIAKHVPFVIGMKKEIPDQTALRFSAGFYRGIGGGREVPFSFQLALSNIAGHGIEGTDLPLLLQNID